jgi:hypothetical protein
MGEGNSPEVTRPGGNIQPSATTTSSGSVPCFIYTKRGTDEAVFKAYIKPLPDKGEGYLDTYKYSAYQTDMTNLTAERGEEVAKQPFVKYAHPIREHPMADM